MVTDVRLVNHEDFSQNSKYTGQYMTDADYYNRAKPIIHLKLDQACRRTMPKDLEGFDYELYFSPETITVCLILASEAANSDTVLYDWAHEVSEYVDSLAIKEFRATDAFPEDSRLSNMMTTLAKTLDEEVVKSEGNNHSITVSVKF